MPRVSGNTELPLWVQSPSKPMPQPDEIVATPYRTPYGDTVDVYGVCKVTEDSVACWKRDGSDNPELRKELLHQLEGSAPGHGQISTLYGNKNRLVVLQTTLPATFAGVRRRWSIVAPEPGNYFRHVAFAGGTYADGRNQVQYSGVGVSAPRDQRTASVLIRVQHPVIEVSTLDIAPGASSSFQGIGFRIRSVDLIKPGSEQSAPYFRGKAWKIQIEIKRPADDETDLEYTPLDHDGNLVRFSDTLGNPLSDKQYEEQRRAYFAAPHTGQLSALMDYVREAVFDGSFDQEGLVTVFDMVDPKAAPTLQINGAVPHYVKLGGIPLDPK